MESRVIGLVERRRLIRDGFVVHLEQSGFVIGASVETPAELVAASSTTRFDGLLVSLAAGAREHLEIPARMRKTCDRRAVFVAVAPPNQPAIVHAARRSGYDVVLDGGDGFDGVPAALRSDVIDITRRSRSHVRIDGVESSCDLTDREVQVLRLISQGFTAREIAVRLQISAKTVENHKQRVFRKLDVQSQSHAVALALRAGLLRSTIDMTASAVR